MKTSNKALTVFTGVPFLIVLLLTLFVNAIPADSLNKFFFEDEFTSGKTRKFSVEDFKEITIGEEGKTKNWIIEIIRGNEPSVEINAPEEVIDNVKAESRRWNGPGLGIGYNSRPAIGRGPSVLIPFSIYIKDAVTLSTDKTSKIYARITTPSVSNITLARGSAAIKISGFNIDTLKIDMKGVGNITGKDCSFNNLALKGEGAVKMDLSEVPVKNADIEFNGHHTIDLLMKGGSLTGTTRKRNHPGRGPENRGTIRYKGDISANEIKSCDSCKVYSN